MLRGPARKQPAAVPPSASRRPGGWDIAPRIGAFLFLGGAALAALSTLLPHTQEMEVTGFLAVAGFQLLAALTVLALPPRHRLAVWVPGAVVVAGIASVSAATYFDGERLGGPPVFSEFFYVWPALYIGYFFERRGMVASLLLIALAYAGVLTAIGVSGAPALTRWVATISVVVGAATALQLLRGHVEDLVGRLREFARIDPLTTLLNRRGFDERFELELNRARRTGAPVALLLGDLDHFKRLNDRFGHPAGDRALAGVGQALAQACRGLDSVARLGDEEFAVLLPATDSDGALEVAERLRAAVSGVVDGDGRSLTISFGVVGYPADGDAPQRLLQLADDALYAAKALGRDRTVVRGRESALIA